ncbi:MAG TPA: DUF2269 domain-containing protein [Burkholderiaceae bacterium]|jgi:uncharacterized membrane protein|nr:DUF2269 domain-containing protein [Burkholderiaceae bacterium]
MEYQIWKWLHILSSTLLFGTGLGTAFFMFFTNRNGDVRAIAVVTRYVVIADWLFTATTVVFQPLSGLMMMHLAGIPLSARWIWLSFALYFLAGACWLPVVWIQMKLRNLAREAVTTGASTLPRQYWKYERIWVLLGIPAFISLVVVFYLMVAKPA